MSRWWTAKEHERIVASQPRYGVSGGAQANGAGHTKWMPCECCGQPFNTTDWPPVTCEQCQQNCIAWCRI